MALSGVLVVMLGVTVSRAVALTRSPVVQSPDATSCLSSVATPGCNTDARLLGVQELAFASMGQWAVARSSASAVVSLARGAAGELAAKDCLQAKDAVQGIPACPKAVRGMLGASQVVLSNVGARNVYVAGTGQRALVTLDLSDTGSLSQKPGPKGCFVAAEGVNIPSCTNQVHGLQRPAKLAMSVNGQVLYVLATDAFSGSVSIRIFDRDLGTGELTPKPGPSGCLGLVPQCTQTTLPGKSARAALASADGRQLYVSTEKGLAAFDIQPDGTLKPGVSGCLVAEPDANAFPTCGVFMNTPNATPVFTALSPSGSRLHAASPVDGIRTLNRNVQTGALSQPAPCCMAPGDAGELTLDNSTLVAVSGPSEVFGVAPGFGLVAQDALTRTPILARIESGANGPKYASSAGGCSADLGPATEPVPGLEVPYLGGIEPCWLGGHGHRDVPQSMAASPDGQHLYLLSSDKGLGPMPSSITTWQRRVGWLQASADVIDVGSVEIGADSQAVIKLSNIGDGSASVSAAKVTGEGFSKQSMTCPPVLGPGGSCAVHVSFAPVASGTTNGALTISTDAFNGVAQVSLKGRGVQGHAVVTPALVDVGPLVVGGAAAKAVVTVTNDGDGVLTVGGVNSSEVGGSLVVLPDHGCTEKKLQPGASCDAVVSVSATAPGASAQAVTFHGANLSESIGSVTILGHGIAPVLSADPASLDLGTVTIGERGDWGLVRLTNAGTAAQVVKGARFAGADADGFRMGRDRCWGQTLDPSESCTVEVAGSPHAAGPTSASLVIDGPGGTLAATQLTVTGTLAAGYPPFPKISEPQEPVEGLSADARCVGDRLFLTHVYRVGASVRLRGAGPASGVGQRVTIFYTATGRRVGSAVLRPDRSFSLTVPLPRRSRNLDAMRYQARLGSQRSQKLKLVRRLETAPAQRIGTSDRIRLRGTITGAIGNPRPRVTVRVADSCRAVSRGTRVAAVRVNAAGAFNATVTLPERYRGADAVYFRATALVSARGGRRTKHFTASLVSGVTLSDATKDGSR